MPDAMPGLTGRELRENWDQDRAANAATLDRIIAESGQRLGGRHNDPAYLVRLAEATAFLADVLDGRRNPMYLQEALSTSDFPLLMGDILDRSMLARYAEYQPSWANYCKRGTVRDFRQARRIAVDGLEGSYYPAYPKPELAGPLEDNDLTETGYTTQVAVYEKAVALNWRMLINDDLDAFRTIPERLARGARRTEERFATTLFVDANGPHATLYSAGNANIINPTNAGAAFTAVNPPLSIAALQEGFAVLANMKDAGGDPIVVESVELVVPPALEITAMNILNAVQLEINAFPGGGSVTGLANSLGQEQRLLVQNWMKNRTRLSVNSYIPIIASNANGSTSWFLFANPDTGRPAVEVTFLRGYEQPGLFQKAPNTMRIGGGVDPLLGDFDTGEIRYKGMHIIGGTRLDAKATVASNGSGA